MYMMQSIGTNQSVNSYKNQRYKYFSNISQNFQHNYPALHLHLLILFIHAISVSTVTKIKITHGSRKDEISK
jgi:hypothetical protein